MIYLPPPKEMSEQLESSRRWRDTGGKEGARFYLAFEQHDRLDLAGVVMYEATLQEASLIGARLDGADLGRALANGLCLDDAQCIGARFYKAELEEASFARAIGRCATFRKADLKAARFVEADLREADFERAVCLRANFRNADLRDARMTGALLIGADFTGALLSGVDLTGAVLDATTRLAPADGTGKIIAEHVHIDGQVVRDSEVRAALAALANS
jgi:uncharacterized protein YjbI with pentapeptide repeats